jgi:integrase
MGLTDMFIRNVRSDKPTGQKHSDGDGMYLLVTPRSKFWRFDYRYLGKRKTLALGVYPDVTLAQARARCLEARKLIAEGVDPGQAKREVKQERMFAATQTFEVVAWLWLEKTAATRAATTRIKVIGWLQKDVFPYLGSLPVANITPRDVLVCIQRMETRGVHESAHRVKQICGQILRFAVATGLADRDVTSDLKGALTVPIRRNYAAITEPKPAGELMRAIFGYTGHAYATAALKLSALLFVRPGELRAAEWAEMDLDDALWRIPGSKMKMRNDHLVPLSKQALALLRELERMTGDGKYVFPSIRSDDRCMSENTVSAALRSLGYAKEVMTAHGFRAMARTMLDEVLEERVDLIEHQLAHAVIDPNGRAYNRTAHLPGRRLMMQRWADYLDQLRMGNAKLGAANS